MHPIEIGLSFLEGIALIISPCILPVLPLVLSASMEGGRKRPFGIILGFVMAFTIFALFSRQLIQALAIDPDIIKYSSLVLLAVFGLVLLSEKLSAYFSALTQRFAGAGSRLSMQTKEGFLSGIGIGMLIGLVWTPCAGPILAAVLVQVIRQENDIHALILVTAFAFGAGIPMLAISLMGRKLLEQFGFLTRHAVGIRKIFGAIVLLAVLFIASGIDIQPRIMDTDVPVDTSQQQLIHPLPHPYPAPEFAGIEAWLNSHPLTLQALKGKVVLIDFWTYSCINCIRTLPYITAWDRKYRDQGLVIVGVHAPEFEFEKEQANVEKAIAKYHIAYPVALDNHLDTWTHFKNRYWPAHYLIDKNGQVVYTHFGEGAYAVTENNIRFLLGLNKMAGTFPESSSFSRNQTAETYLGSKRAARFSSPEKLLPNQVQQFHLPENTLPLHHWALVGKWRVEGQRIIAEEAGATLRLRFMAGKVFLVLGTPHGQPLKVNVQLNGKPLGKQAGKDSVDGKLIVDQHSLYELVDQGGAKEGIVEITAGAPGLEAYAFTFGN